jgi:hypothetical protein
LKRDLSQIAESNLNDNLMNKNLLFQEKWRVQLKSVVKTSKKIEHSLFEPKKKDNECG